MSRSRWKSPTPAEEAAETTEIGDGVGTAAIVVRVSVALRRKLNELAWSRHVSANTVIRELILRELADAAAKIRRPAGSRRPSPSPQPPISDHPFFERSDP